MKFNEGKESPIAVLIVVLILAAIGYWVVKSGPTGVISDTNNSSNNGIIPFPYPNGGPNNNSNVNVKIPVGPLSYQDAVVIYKDTRIQFDANCKATPNNVTFKNGTDIMIDNRAPVARTIKIDTNYTVGAYGFKIIKLSSATLPVTWLLDCDKSQNVATILLQK